jgi:hypothetical protein
VTNQSAPCLEFAKRVTRHDSINVWVAERTTDYSCWGYNHGCANVRAFDNRD